MNSLTPALAKEIDQLFAAWDRSDSPGAALAVVQDGEIVHSRGYGMAHLEQNVPITPSSIFHLASVSKQFTAFCTLLLDAEARLGLDDDVRQYVPEVPDFGVPVTIRQLIHHTSGLRDQWTLLRLAGWRDDDLVTPQDVLDVTALQQRLNFLPGSQYRYSNTGYTLLAVVVERVTGQSLRQFAQERIFGPLGMTHTHFHDDHSEIVPGRTQAYNSRPDGRLFIHTPVYDTVGATSLFSTVEDLARWDRNFEERAVGAEVIGRMTEPFQLRNGRSTTYRAGLRVFEHRGLSIVEHAGGDYGYSTEFLHVPGHRFTVICLANTPSVAPTKRALEIVELCLADRLAAPVPSFSLQGLDLAKLAGYYRNQLTGELVQIRQAGDELTLGVVAPLPLVRAADGVLTVDGDRSMALLLPDGAAGASIFLADERSGGEPQVCLKIESPSVAADELDDYRGAYVCPELFGVVYRIERDGDRLVLQRLKFDDLPLEVPVRDLAVGNSPRVYGVLQFDFQRNGDSRVDGFLLSNARVNGLLFRRVAAG